MQKDECLCSTCKNPKEGSFCDFCKKETPKAYTIHAETGKFSVKGGEVGMSIIRGDLSVTYFTVVFSVLVTMILGLMAFVPDGVLIWYWRLIVSVALIVIAFRFCFFNDWFRGFIVSVFTKIKNHKETC